MARQIVVAAAIIWCSGKYLAAQRPLGGAYGGQWEFPGGKLEPGETAEQALLRELKEELDITAEDSKFFYTLEHVYPEFHMTMHLYEVTRFSGEIAALEKQTLAWLTPVEALGMPFLAADLPIVRRLASAF